MKVWNLTKLWKSKWKILEGIKNSVFKRAYVENIKEARLVICRKNSCGYYNVKGDADICYVKGKECCNACGCNSILLARSLSASCSLFKVGKTPLWDAVMSKEEEDKFRTKTGIKNEL